MNKKMIERFYLKEYLSFKEVTLEFQNGLVVFTGPSGSGKSILMNAILSSLGIGSCDASVSESCVSWDMQTDKTGIFNENINVFRQLKKEKARYFINNQSLPKKSLANITLKYLRHLSLKDYSDFENKNLLDILDKKIQSKKFHTAKKEYQKKYSIFKEVTSALQKVLDEEKKIAELKEFTSFEISKIEKLDPKVEEDKELLEIKKELSRKEKALEHINNAKVLFDVEHYVGNALDILDVDSAFFSDTMNELRAILDNAQEKFSALDEVDIEEVLNRIEALSSLKRRYGSIEAALEYKEEKKRELEKYENIETHKNELQKKYDKIAQEIDALAKILTSFRKEYLDSFEIKLNNYLHELYLRDAKVALYQGELGGIGEDVLEITLKGTPLQKMSTGEFNRLRLAILALKSEDMQTSGGILMLDEIDANLSGEESMSVAKVLRHLAKHFQIFVISHQPQLTSMGNQHFLVYKENDISCVKELDFQSRVNEIARIISGDKISQEAKVFAKELLCVS